MDIDWAVVPLSAFVSATVALAIRWLDTPRPRLVATGRLVGVPVGTDEETIRLLGAPVTITNHGDGAAYDVSVAGSNCVVGVRQGKKHAFGGESWADRLPVLEAGETVVLDVQGWDKEDRSARIVLSHPRRAAFRWWKRTWVWSLSELPAENPFPSAMYPPEKIPWLWRRLGYVRKYGLQARVNAHDQSPFEDSDNAESDADREDA